MPTFRPDLETIPRYVPGKPVEEVARELGVDSIGKLASNECPEPPFPEVIDAITEAGTAINRYPDSSGYELTMAIAAHQGVSRSNVWVGSGSSEILRCIALSVGGPNTSAVFAAPSFIMYTIGTLVAGSEAITVPLTETFDHDLDAMLAAVRDDTNVLYVCNPNNPTGGIRSGSDVRGLLDQVPQRVTVVIDEAYAEYATDPSYESMIDEAVTRPNVIVARTFSKIYGLAGLRVGYAIGDEELLNRVRTTQAPFSVNTVAQSAAIEALRHQHRVAERRDANEKGRQDLITGFAERGVNVASTQANFVYFEPDASASALHDELLRQGVIVRSLGQGIRVTVGTREENARMFAAWDAVANQHA
ncbi:MAG: histidinol-phosphate transaminase [Acidimicrobiia bacterium]